MNSTLHRRSLLCLVVAHLLGPSILSSQETGLRPPSIKNLTDVQRKLAQEYPLEMRRAGVVGEAQLELTVGTNGRPRDIRIAAESGTLVLDAAALKVARSIRFHPARDDRGAVEQLVRFPLSFQSTCGRTPERVGEPDRQEALEGLNPALIDAFDEDNAAMALVEVELDATGRPTSSRIIDSTGLAAADTFVVRLALGTSYEPVEWDGRPVPSRFRTVVSPEVAPGAPDEERSDCGDGRGPRLKNINSIRRGLEPIVLSLRRRGVRETQNATAMMWVGTDGSTGSVRIVESSCSDEIDRKVSDVLKSAEFEPARCDSGDPIGVWVMQRVDLHMDR